MRDFVAEIDHARDFVVGHCRQQAMRTACREPCVRQAGANFFRCAPIKTREFNVLDADRRDLGQRAIEILSQQGVKNIKLNAKFVWSKLAASRKS